MGLFSFCFHNIDDTGKCCKTGTGDKPKRWNGEAIDDFYKGNLPKWISDDALMPCSKQDQFYEVQESEIREHNWLNLYTEIALYSLWEGDMRLGSCVPLQIMKVIVETREAVDCGVKGKVDGWECNLLH